MNKQSRMIRYGKGAKKVTTEKVSNTGRIAKDIERMLKSKI